MGNSESAPPLPGGGSEGYHVLRVQDNSPGQMAGLEAFFDFIVAVGNKRLDRDDESFKQILSQSVDKPLELTVYNSKSQTVRQTQIIPSNSWGGQGILGISIRFCSFDGANQNVWHIISVQPNSPAYQAGLQADYDYVLGAESVLQQADDLIALVQANVGKPVKLYVYNVETDAVREVTLTPNDGWGGEGCLGCDIGYGYLHRIPSSVDRSSVQTPLGVVSSQNSSIPQPGYTGIPQLDQIQTSVAATTAASIHFPDPSEFSVSSSVTTSVPVTTLVNNGLNYSTGSLDSKIDLPSQESKFTGAHNQTTYSQSDAKELVPNSGYDYVHPPRTNAPNLTPSIANAVPPSYSTPGYYNTPYQHSQPPVPVLPPTSIPYSSCPPPNLPGAQPLGHLPTIPQVPAIPEVGNAQQFYQPHLQPGLAPGNLPISGSYRPEIPINTSSYQPYLAYGAPAPPPTFEANIYSQSGPQSVSQPAQTYYQPSNLGFPQPTTSAPQPPIASPNLNFPMPPLSSLGINNLVPPVGEFRQPDQNQKTQF